MCNALFHLFLRFDNGVAMYCQTALEKRVFRFAFGFGGTRKCKWGMGRFVIVLNQWHGDNASLYCIWNPTSSNANTSSHVIFCRVHFHEECLKHHGHKGDPRVTPKTCGAVSERGQVILVWVRAPSDGNTSHPQRLGVTRVRSWAMRSLWLVDSRMLKNTLIKGMS